MVLNLALSHRLPTDRRAELAGRARCSPIVLRLWHERQRAAPLLRAYVPPSPSGTVWAGWAGGVGAPRVWRARCSPIVLRLWHERQRAAPLLRAYVPPSPSGTMWSACAVEIGSPRLSRSPVPPSPQLRSRLITARRHARCSALQ